MVVSRSQTSTPSQCARVSRLSPVFHVRVSSTCLCVNLLGDTSLAPSIPGTTDNKKLDRGLGMSIHIQLKGVEKRETTRQDASSQKRV